MELLFLGTSAGTPTRSRNVTACALIEDSGHWLLIDCGEATQHQLLRAPISFAKLQAILITHVHGDHCYGLPGLLATMAMAGRKTPLAVVAPAGIAEWLAATQAHTALHLPYELQFLATETLRDARVGGFEVTSTALAHTIASYAYTFVEVDSERALDQEKLQASGLPRGPLWGCLQQGEEVMFEGARYRLRDYLKNPRPPRRLTIAGDNERPDLLAQACAGGHLLVHEATFSQPVAERLDNRYGHSTARDVGAFAERIGLPNLILTHFSPRYQADPARSPSIADIEAEAAAVYSGRLFLADDFARLTLAKTGEITLGQGCEV